LVKAAISRIRISQGLLLVSIVLLAASAFAANKGSFELQHPALVAGKQLAPGTYKVQWEGSGDQVQLSIMQGSKQLATASAHVVPVQVAPSNDSALINVNPDGSRSVAQLRFRGKKFALDISGEGGGAGGAAGAGR
jgi:hypothetical protein